MLRDFDDKTVEGVIDHIIWINETVISAWKTHSGWAPPVAARMLDKSRLDWVESLGHTLRIWVEKPSPKEHDGRLILAWTNLGCLVEGTIKFFLSVYAQSYEREVIALAQDELRSLASKSGQPKELDSLTFQGLREFLVKRVLASDVREWDTWLQHIQERRNAIHAYKHREIGSFDEFWNDVRIYVRFLEQLTGQLPDLPDPREYYA